MALGTNYKRIGSKEDSLIARRLEAHDNRYKELRKQGYSKEQASKIAFKEILDGTLKY